MKLLTFIVFIWTLDILPSLAKIEPWQGEHWQGDIALNPQQQLIIAGGARSSNTGLLNLVKRWPKVGGYVWVPFTFDHDFGNFSKADKSLIYRDLRTLEKKTCIRFTARTNQTDFIRIINATGCWSRLGMQGGMQSISFENPGCVYNGTPVHEFIHALGYTHMQNHIDRDQFVTINFNNIDPTKKFNFDKVNATEYGNFNTTYDYFSVMHYNRKSFSINGNNTIVPTNSSYMDIIGQNKISPGDIARINNMYEC